MKYTERSLLGLLSKRYNITEGNGVRFAFATHVRTAAGFDANNTIDAVAMDLWPSKGFTLHAFEVKCSRGDWLNEIRDRVVKKGYTVPEYRSGDYVRAERTYPPIIRKAFTKSEEARKLCDSFTIVAAPDIVKLEDLPDGWGLLEAHDCKDGVTLRSRRTAQVKSWTRRTNPSGRMDLERTFVASFARAVAKTTINQEYLEDSL